MGRFYRAGMQQLAAEKVTEGRQLVDTHREATATYPGLCGSCGRLWPCDDRKRGAELIDLYTQLASPDQPDNASDGEPPAVLVRPYVVSNVLRYLFGKLGPNLGPWSARRML